MNRSKRLIEVLTMPDLVYSSKTGLKLLRYGQLYNRFDQSADLHYNDAPEKKGTWASIFPYAPFIHTPDQHDNKRHLDNRDQTIKTKIVYHDIQNSISLKPITFFWRFNIYSHISKSGEYNNKGWIYYRSTEELVNVIRGNFTKLQQSVVNANLASVNSDIRYFKNHQYEVFVPHESFTKTP